jgi:DNA-binding NarL/FixJ family response regulator
MRILVADDSPEFRQNARLMLAHERDVEVVVVARDGLEAVELAKRLQPTVAVVDVNMPRMDGLEALAELLKVSPRTGVMIISGERGREVMLEVERFGVREFLQKPFPPEEFIAAIRRTAAQAAQAEQNRSLAQLVLTFLKTGRMDDEAARAYADYIRQPTVETDLMARLAEIFCARRDWRDLRLICERMEKLDSGQH